MIRAIARFADVLERGIWGMRFGRRLVTVNAPWSLILIDAYKIRHSRGYRLRGWQLVIHKL